MCPGVRQGMLAEGLQNQDVPVRDSNRPVQSLLRPPRRAFDMTEAAHPAKE